MSFFSELKAHKYTALKTFMLYLMILIAGMNTALCGVTMLDLQLAVNTTSEKITAILPSSSVGFAFGSIAYGFLADHIDVQIILLVTSIILSLSNALIPWNTSLIYLCANMAFNGILFGIIVNGGNVWTLHLWGTESPPFIQALHFAFGFGALIAPLIAEPFLLEIEEKNSTNSTSSYLIMNPEEELKVHYPYLIVSCLLVIILIMFALVCLIRPSNEAHPTRKKVVEEKSKSPVSFLALCVIVFVSCVFLFFYTGLELLFGTMLTTYVVKSDLKLSKSTGSFMTSAYWTTFTFFRCFAIFLVELIGCQNLIISNLFLIMLSNFILLPFGNTHLWSLWVGIILMGLGTSPIIGAIFGFLQDFIFISSKTASTLFISGSIGQFIIPYATGNFLTTHPPVFLYISFICGVMTCVIHVILTCFRRHYIKQKMKINLQDCDQNDANYELRVLAHDK